MNDIPKLIGELRSKYEVLRDDKLPIDIFTFTEVDLGLDVIPFDDLAAKFAADAALLMDFSGIYVDAEQYDLMEKGPEWKLRRLRFSMAHELGHFYLHRNHHSYKSPLADFKAWTNDTSHEKYQIEHAANEFGGNLLVPENRLKNYFDQFAEKIEPMMPNFRNSDGLRSQFCESATGIFQVGEIAISIRLDREKIWEAN
jgi:hypothetical protein